MDDDKKKALGAALGQIEKQFGKGSYWYLIKAVSIALFEWQFKSTNPLGFLAIA